MIIFTDGGKFPATKEMIGFPQVTKILSKFSLRTKIKVNISTKLYRFPPIRQDSLTGRKSCESKGGVVSPVGFPYTLQSMKYPYSREKFLHVTALT